MSVVTRSKPENFLYNCVKAYFRENFVDYSKQKKAIAPKIIHKMSSYSMDVEMFISEVKKFPEIWNNNSEDSRSPMRRLQAWSEIARVFIEDFDDLCELEKNDVFKKLQGKWRNIRDSFVRHKRRNYAARKKGYIYAKHLTFLEDVYKTSQSGSDNDVQHEADDTWSGDEESKIKKMLFKTGFDTKEELLVEWPDQPREKKRKKPSKRETQIDFVETNFPEASCSYENEDEDRSFFLSLIPAVRDFDVDKKLEFRSELLKLIKKYRQEKRRAKLEADSDG